jgi:KilA-N domain
LAKTTSQLDLFVPHAYHGQTIEQRAKDGYINATTMCQAAGRNWADYSRLNATQAFLPELSADMGIPISDLVQSVRGGPPHRQGTWVHPQVAINLAQWLSPRFAVLVSKWVVDWMSGGGARQPGKLPYHLRRYIDNQMNVPKGHFSVLNEITLGLIAPLEAQGYLSLTQLACDGPDGDKALVPKLGDCRGQRLSSHVRGMLLCLSIVDPDALAPGEQVQARQHPHYGGVMPSTVPCSRYSSSVQLVR